MTFEICSNYLLCRIIVIYRYAIRRIYIRLLLSKKLNSDCIIHNTSCHVIFDLNFLKKYLFFSGDFSSTRVILFSRFLVAIMAFNYDCINPLVKTSLNLAPIEKKKYKITKFHVFIEVLEKDKGDDNRENYITFKKTNKSYTNLLHEYARKKLRTYPSYELKVLG